VPVVLEQDLDGKVAPQVGVAALEHGTHAAASNLAEQPDPRRAVARPR